MELDCFVAEEEGRGNFLVRLALRDEERDLQLLGRELLRLVRVRPPAVALARRAQLRARPLRPRGGAEILERRQRRSQVHAGVATPAAPAESLSERELRPRSRERVVDALMQLEGARERVLELLLAGDQTAHAGAHGRTPRRPRSLDALDRRADAGVGLADPAEADERLEAIGLG